MIIIKLKINISDLFEKYTYNILYYAYFVFLFLFTYNLSILESIVSVKLQHTIFGCNTMLLLTNK